MNGTRRWLLPALAYTCVAVFLIWPGVSNPLGAVPGGSRTDLWNGLWSLDFARDALLSGQAPWQVDVLAYRGPFGENGGLLPPVDPLAVLLFLPLGALGIPLGYNVLILTRLVLGGLIAQRFVEELAEHHGATPEGALRGGWVAGVALTGAPVLIAGVHNGTSEAANATGLIFAVWMGWRFGRDPSLRGALWLAVGLLWATLSSWYVAVLAFGYAGLVALFAAQSWPFIKRWIPIGVGLVLVAPWLGGVMHLLQPGPSNLSSHSFALSEMLSAEGPTQVAGLEENFAALDLQGWLGKSGNRDVAVHSPSERGQGFFHNGHIAWAIALSGLIGLWRLGRKELPMLGLAVVSVLLSFGTSLEIGGQSIWMPLATLKSYPGFSQLGLPFRFGIGAAVILAVGAGLWASRRSSAWCWGVVGLVLIQLRFVSPLAGGVPATALDTSSALHALKAAPDGAVLHFPLVGQQPTLYSQRIHDKPVTSALNWASSEIDLALWSAAREFLMRENVEGFQGRAEELGIRYLVVHAKDPKLRGDANWSLYRIIRDSGDFEVLGSNESGADVEVYALW